MPSLPKLKCCQPFRSKYLVDFSKACVALARDDVNVFRNIITQEQHDHLVDILIPYFKKKRYESNHWDSVILDYKEKEFLDHAWPASAKIIIDQVRDIKGPWLPVHVIDLSPTGYIKPHVDSVKFSGKIVAGLSLLSASIMELKGEGFDSQVNLLLPPRSLYILRGNARYRYTHEICQSDVNSNNYWRGKEYHRGRRMSLIFRDALVNSSNEAENLEREQTET